MIINYHISLHCPYCGFNKVARANINYKAVECPRCENHPAWMEPQEITMVCLSKYADFEDGKQKFIPNFPMSEYDLKIGAEINPDKFKHIEKTGIDECCTWELRTAMASFIAPIITNWLESGPNGFPTYDSKHKKELTYDDWIEILEKIHNSMLIISKDNVTMKNMGQVQEGCDLLGQWFMALWD